MFIISILNKKNELRTKNLKTQNYEKKIITNSNSESFDFPKL